MKDQLLLTAEKINVAYGKKQILFDVSVNINEGEIVTLIGPNGSGKSTFLKAVSGLLPLMNGKLYFRNYDITDLSLQKRIEMGIGYFLQGGEIFPNLSIFDNLKVGGFELTRQLFQNMLVEIYNLFPMLEKNKNKRAGLLSGGERKALALSIILMRKPKLLLLDEPSAGLSPTIVKDIMTKIQEIRNKFGVTILLVEQNIKEALPIATRFYLLKTGKIIGIESPSEIIQKRKLEELFFK